MITRTLIGIDVSKDWFDSALRKGSRDPVQRFDQTKEGYALFVEWVQTHSPKDVWVCMEHTGGYEYPLARACLAAGLKVSIVDGNAITKYRESFGRTKAKTDACDARLIARYAHERNPAQWNPNPEEYRELTAMVRHRQDLIDQRHAWMCRSKNACESEFVVQQRNCQLQVLNEQIRELEKALKAHVKSHPSLKEDVKLLDSLEGVAFISAVRILAELGTIDNYASGKSVALFAGLSPVARESGKKAGKRWLPVYGNMQLRCALYWPVVVAMRIKKTFSTFTDRIHSNGNKLNMTVITAGMRKLAQLIYGILKHRTPYNSELFISQMNGR